MTEHDSSLEHITDHGATALSSIHPLMESSESHRAPTIDEPERDPERGAMDPNGTLGSTSTSYDQGDSTMEQTNDEEAAPSTHMEYTMDAVMESMDSDTRKRKADKGLDGPTEATRESDAPPDKTTSPAGKRGRSGTARVSWDERMASLAQYKATHGDLNISIRYKLNPSLGKFVHNTREQYKLFHGRSKNGYQKTCSLTAERIAQLDAMGFLWTTQRTKRQNDDWNTRLEQLKEYKATHGHCLIPHGYAADPSLAEWIHRQRTTYATMLKAKSPSPMIVERMDKLTELGFNFAVHTDKWMEHWYLLKECKEKHGDAVVPTHFDDNPSLGRWTHTQRHQRRLLARGRKSCMTPERINLLDELGFVWEVRPAMEQPRATWQQRLDELKRFYLEQGHFLISSETHPKLHIWSHEQRSRLLHLHVTGKDASRRMGLDRVQTLEALGFTKDTPLLDLCSVMPGVVGDDDLLAPVLEHFAMDASAAAEEGVDEECPPSDAAPPAHLAEGAISRDRAGAVHEPGTDSIEPMADTDHGAPMEDATAGNDDMVHDPSGSVSFLDKEELDQMAQIEV